MTAEIIRAAERGWCLHPLKPREKTPLLKDWPSRATSDLPQLTQWEKQFPSCNWGILTGAKSGFFVVDCDGEEGMDWLKMRIDAGDDLPESWAVHTDRGLHLYFAVPPGRTIRTSAGKIAPRVDVRGEGGYVACPPSMHPSGRQYTAVEDSCPVSPPPEWLLNVIQSAPPPVAPKTEQPIRYEVLPEGRRNDGLARYAGALRRKGCNHPQIEAELLKANIRRCQPPLGDSEVLKIAASVSRYEPGGPDPLEQAWQAIHGGNWNNRFEQFIALVSQLQSQRPGLDIALPLVRIAALFGVHFTAVSQWRKKAVATGVLTPTGQYRPHRRAGLYRLTDQL